jgi:hypothetical protein
MPIPLATVCLPSSLASFAINGAGGGKFAAD